MYDIGIIYNLFKIDFIKSGLKICVRIQLYTSNWEIRMIPT